MSKYAFLCGSAPEDFRQKKLIEMQEFLISEEGGSLPERNVCVFPNGVSELLLEYGLNNIFDGKAGDEADSILLYFCTERPVRDDDSSVWLGGEEIRREVISYYENLAKKCGIGFQVIFDSDSEFVAEEALGWEKVAAEDFRRNMA